MIIAKRYHDISCGHRVVGHEGKCTMLHGHNYRITFHCTADDVLDSVGRVIDFGVIKEKLCLWLEDNWDHKFLAWDQDQDMHALQPRHYDHGDPQVGAANLLAASIVWVPFNPTAENIGLHLLNVVGPDRLKRDGVRLVRVDVEETRKCSASVLT